MADGRVLIAGAGIAGLAAALRLHRDGYEVVVVERAEGRRTGGYLVNLLGSGFDAADRLGIVDQLRRHDQGAFTSNVVRADGTVRFTLPAAMAESALGTRVLTVFRGDLESVLHDAVAAAVGIRYGTTVTGIEPDGARPLRVTLSDGTVDEVDLVIGADGVHSGVRALAFGPEEEFVRDMGHVVAAFPLDAPPATTPPRTADTFIDVGRTAAVFHPRAGAASAFFTYRTDSTQGELEAGVAAALAERYADLAGELRAVLDSRAAHSRGAYFDAVSQVVMDCWSTGRTVLLGDAAWCVSLFAGHGAGLALAGADRLGIALAEHPDDVTAALRTWEQGLRDEVREHQRKARLGMARYAPPSRVHLEIQNLMIRALTLPGVGRLLRPRGPK
ncbi:FAD-dependent monooxygenase [Tsukamurella sp. PLM1]|uniref:FAD-dependent monooxygenase n=1 Tax=Tsukamurella sp. PLM1 TaxID=2929795 RepID=UPI00205A4DE0|nr:FAD-dependent monooxygenase [Tsukamurella sp. PLM1]BDH56191.1 oxidoreductase [Tsukamurella sp. PLM1]